MSCRSVFISYLVILIRLTSVLGDCGFPALPVHMKVRPFVSAYIEGDSVEYYCEYNDMTLIGNTSRKCINSRWTGDIPHCVRELPRRYLDRIELVNIKNHSVTAKQNINYYYSMDAMKDFEKYQKMTFYGNYDQRSTECIHAKTKSTVPDLEWVLVFRYPIAQVYKVDLVVYKESIDSRIDVYKSESVISSVFVSEFRECRPQPVTTIDMNEKLLKYSFICEVKDKDLTRDQDEFMSLRLETRKNISITFAVNDLIVCEVHVMKTLPFRSYTSGSCGSPDVPLFSNYTPIFDEITQSPIPIGYRFACEDGFKLEGNPDVLCGIENKWMDPFPTCKPTHSCKMVTKERMKELTVTVNYRNLFSFDGNITAINATQAIYSCDQDQQRDSNVNVTLIGDSIRFCQLSGNWSGEEPVCLEQNDLTFYLAELNENILQWDSKLPKFALHQHRPDECHIPAIPKYAKVFTYEQNLLSIYMAAVKERIDLMPTYPNGSVITYNCESRFDYMASDFEARTCVNGSWVGPIGKCYTATGGKDVARLVGMQEFFNDDLRPQRYIPINEDKSDQYWTYFEKDNKDCINLDIQNKEAKQFKWQMYLSSPLRISYFAVRFGNKDMFHTLEDSMLAVHRADQLTKESPVLAHIDSYNYYSPQIDCEVTKVIEVSGYDDYDGLTQVSFRCAEADKEKEKEKDKKSKHSHHTTVYNNFYEMKSSSVTIQLKPELFHENFNSSAITFCSIMFFEASDDCGLPEQVANADIISDHNSGYVRYRCKDGYRLVGNEYVRCSKLGNWMDNFPRCELYKLCEKKPFNKSEVLQRVYYNTVIINNEDAAVLGTIVEYSCKMESVSKGLHVMIGPRTAVCTESGKWSADEPICADDKYIHDTMPTYQAQTRSTGYAVPLISFVLIITLLVVILAVIGCRHYGFSNPMLSMMTNRRPTRQSSSFISYGQSNLRDSVSSFGDGFASTISGHNSNDYSNA